MGLLLRCPSWLALQLACLEICETEQIRLTSLLRPGFDSFSDDMWVTQLVDFTKKAIDGGKVKVIGVCFGHQIVGRALGAKVARSEGGAWEASVCQVNQTPKGKELFGGNDTMVQDQ